LVQCPADQLSTILLLQGNFRVIRGVGNGGLNRVIQFIVGPTTTRRERLETGNRQQPRQYRGAPFEPIRLPPHVEKHLAQNVLGRGSVLDEAKKPAVDVGAMPGEERMYSKFITGGYTGE
jgi:hypothetical protein